MTIYVVAQSKPPVVWCPPWCENTNDHVAELENWEGRAVHSGGWPTRLGLGLGRTLLPNGDADEREDDPRWAGVTISVGNREMTLVEAEEFAAMLAEVIVAAQVEEARTTES